MLIRALLSGALALTTFSSLAAESSVRMITTATTESAPLNLVGRSFSRLESDLADNIETQRLTYLVKPKPGHVADSSPLPALRELLANISADASVISVSGASTTQARDHADAFIRLLTQTLTRPANLDSTERLRLALNAALSRQDVKFFSAEVAEDSFLTHYLILFDEETSDLLLLLISRPSGAK